MQSIEHQHNIFHTPIWGYTLSSEKYAISDYIDYVIELSNSEPSQAKSNAGGWQSRDNLHKEGIFRELVNNTLSRIATNILDNFSPKQAEIQSLWANVNYQNTCNFHHTHEGELSGVIYLQTPPTSGRLVFVNPAVRAHASVVKANNYAIAPSPLACLIFPSWLEHYVEPNLATQPRIGLSFNIGLI